ncbi:MAG: hypothetical protein NW241_21910 [Bacteroidia bacterium]|nr:hypothetical protein [Bacteroidia bacterium]
MNSFLRKIKNESYRPPGEGAPLLFRKPPEICNPAVKTLPVSWRDKLEFADRWCGAIHVIVQQHQLRVKLIEDKDTPAIRRFLHRRYPPRLADEICAFDLYRFRTYGHGVVLEDAAGEVQGTIFEEGYDTPEKTSFTLRLAVSEELKGKNLGYYLMMYSCMQAMRSGSRIKRGLIEFNNLKSLHINLNKVGWICDHFEPSISELGSFFEIALPLDPEGLTANAVDFEKVRDYLRRKQPGRDFRLIPSYDFDAVCRLYEQTDFKIVALVPQRIGLEHTAFLALPEAAIQFQRWK